MAAGDALEAEQIPAAECLAEEDGGGLYGETSPLVRTEKQAEA